MIKFSDIQIGYRFVNKVGDWFTVQNINDSKNINVISDLGYNTTTQMMRIRDGSIKDKNKRTICGVGYLGGDKYFASDDSVIYTRWKNMIIRCYDEDSRHLHPSYIGCTVHPEWHNFQNYAIWFESNKPVDFDSVKYHVDKDIKFPGNKIYSSNTCIFATERENTSESGKRQATNNKIFYTFSTPSGSIVTTNNITEFARNNSLNIKSFQNALKKESANFLKGYSFISREEK